MTFSGLLLVLANSTALSALASKTVYDLLINKRRFLRELAMGPDTADAAITAAEARRARSDRSTKFTFLFLAVSYTLFLTEALMTSHSSALDPPVTRAQLTIALMPLEDRLARLERDLGTPPGGGSLTLGDIRARLAVIDQELVAIRGERHREAHETDIQIKRLTKLVADLKDLVTEALAPKAHIRTRSAGAE